MEVLKLLTDYYGSYDEDNRLRSQHGSVELLTTMRYVEKYLQPGMRVLEIGAATGRYSHALARQGYKVDAVELVQHNIDIFKDNILPGEDVRIFHGNAKNLDMLGDNTYDITLLLGPIPNERNRKIEIYKSAGARYLCPDGGQAVYCI